MNVMKNMDINLHSVRRRRRQEEGEEGRISVILNESCHLLKEYTFCAAHLSAISGRKKEKVEACHQ